MGTKCLLSVILLFINCCGFLEGARRVDVAKRFAAGMEDYAHWRARRNPGNVLPPPKPEELLGLQSGEHLSDGVTITTASHTHKEKLTETYEGLPVFGQSVVIETSEGEPTGSISGHLIEGIHDDVPSTDPEINEDQVLQIATSYMGDNPGDIKSGSTHITLEVYVEDQAATVEVISFLAYSLSYTILRNNEPSRPSFIINANTGEVVRQWEALTSHRAKRQARYAHLRTRSPAQSEGQRYEFHAIGGNIKMGKNLYGDRLPALYVTQIDDTCYLENDKIKVINAQESSSETFSFPCEQGFNDSINEAYSPMADAFFYGTMTYDLFKQWLGVDPLSFKIEMVIHEGSGFENAYWDGQKTYFGDGYSTFYPLIILDIAAHEVGHGFTEQNSGLIYDAQSGGMNEAFSDMAGIAAEEYMKSAKEWMLGEDAFKADGEALRYIKDPSQDGISASDMGQYCPGMDVHHSSGIYNRAFYLLSKNPGWTVRMAFQTFATANQLYWTPDSTFSEGACGVVQAATDLGYNVEDIVHVFSEVGVSACGASTGSSGFELTTDMHALHNESLSFSFTLDDHEDITYLTVETYGDVYGQVPWLLYVQTPRRLLSTTQDSDSLNIYNPQPGLYTVTLEAVDTFSMADLYIIKEQVILADLSDELDTQFNGTFLLPEHVVAAGHPVALRAGFPHSDSDDYPIGFLVNYEQPIEDNRGQIRPCARSNIKKNIMEAFIRHPQAGTYYYQIGETYETYDYSITNSDIPAGLKLYIEVLIMPEVN